MRNDAPSPSSLCQEAEETKIPIPRRVGKSQSKGKTIYKVYLTELANSVKNYSKESFPLSFPLPR